MLKFDFQDYAGFQERFGIQEHGNGSKSRKNKILLAFVKSEFQKKNFEVINFKTMAEMAAYVWGRLLNASQNDSSLTYRVELMEFALYSNIYQTDGWNGVCEDHDTRSIRYQNMEQAGRVYKMKAGKMLHHLITCTEYGRGLAEPVQRWLEEDFAQRWQSYCMGKLPENHLIINDDFKRIYNGDDCVGSFHSCMVNQDHWHFYRNSVNAKAAFLVDSDDMVIARAILWPEVYDDEGNKYRYLDRQYSTDGNVVLMRALIDELIKADEIDCYKVPGCGCGEATAIVDAKGNSLSDKTFHIKCTVDTDQVISYMDTFKWYDYNAEKAYNTSKHGWDYALDTTSYSIDDDDDYDDSNYDDYHQQYTDDEVSLVYVHGEEMYCADGWLDDFRTVESDGELHHKDDVFECPYCKCYELNESKVYSDLIKMDFCCTDCLEKAEKEYKEKNWYYSDFDQEYFENQEDITFYNCWNPETKTYSERSISKKTLGVMVEQGLMFLFSGEYCDAIDPLTNQPYKKAA